MDHCATDHDSPHAARLALLLSGLLSLLGCDNSACRGDQRCFVEDAGPRCPNAPATLADCSRVGAAYADCGGPPGPFLACAGADCRWFGGACMPPDFRMSPCSADAVCCQDDWPWPPDPVTRLPTEQLAFGFLYGFGHDPWSTGHALDVTVVAVPDPLPERGLTCEGLLDTSESPCAEPTETVLRDNGGRFGPVSLTVRDTAQQRSGWELLIEVEGTRARVCILPFTDFQPARCSLPGVWPGACATSGSVSVSGSTGTLDVTFPNGGTLSGRF
jgi:hypothetical protein